MEDITKNEMGFLLKLWKNPKKDYNARSLSKEIGLTHAGTFKIAKKLEQKGIITPKRIGNVVIYKINKSSDYAKDYILFLIRKEKYAVSPYAKKWIRELKEISSAYIIILFGSVLRKDEKAKDIDVVFVTDNKKIKVLEKEIKDINSISASKIHPIYQSEKDIKENIKKGDKIILSSLNGIIVKGEEKLWGLVE